MIKFENYVKVQSLIAACLNLGELVNGYGVAWSAPILPKLQDPEQTPLGYPLTEIQQSWAASSMYLGAPGAFLGGYLANKIGRRKTLIFGGLLNLLAYVVLTSARNLAMVHIGRILVGAGMSLLMVAGLIYIGEIASPNIRGMILTTMGVFHAIGGLIVYSVGPFVSYAGVGYVVIAINVAFIVSCWFLPESPMYYVIKDDEASARSALEYLGRGNNVTNELKALMEKFHEQQQKKHVWRELLTLKINQRSLVIAMGLAFFQQCCGIVSVIFYATTILEDAGSSIRPDIATIIIGAVFAVGTCISSLFIENYGRRVLLMISAAGCCASMTVLGVYFYLKMIKLTFIDTLGWMPLTSLVVAISTYSFGLNMIPNAMIGELFTPRARGVGSSATVICSWIVGFISVTCFGHVITALGGHITFWIYGGVNAAAFLFVMLVVPETKGKSLMEIQMTLDSRKVGQ